MGSDYIPFSQRERYAPIPPQLELGEVSKELRRYIDYAFYQAHAVGTNVGYERAMYVDHWREIAQDFNIYILKNSARSFSEEPHHFRSTVEGFCAKWSLPLLFDLVEFFARHPNCPGKLVHDLEQAFVTARAAYRLVDKQIIAIGTAEQGEAVQRAIDEAEGKSAGARHHLINAGAELRSGHWADSIRESIHAVESVCVKLAPGAKTFQDALKELEARGHLHTALKQGFNKIYGYTSDEDGIRHAVVFEDKPNVDEADALFMLGACASFVSYVLARA